MSKVFSAHEQRITHYQKPPDTTCVLVPSKGSDGIKRRVETVVDFDARTLYEFIFNARTGVELMKGLYDGDVKE